LKSLNGYEGVCSVNAHQLHANIDHAIDHHAIGTHAIPTGTYVQFHHWFTINGFIIVTQSTYDVIVIVVASLIFHQNSAPLQNFFKLACHNFIS